MTTNETKITKLPISAMLVGYNEEHLLLNCLNSISFCDEIIYIDLGSKDNSISIAKKYTNHIFTRELVPSGEYIHAEFVNYTKNDWVLFIDPDENVCLELQNEIIKNFEYYNNSDSIGAILVPWIFYFKRHKLKGTTWGGINKKYILANKKRFDFLPITHYGRKLKPEYSTYEIEINNKQSNVLNHYWMPSTSVFLRKHFRYLKKEGIDNYNMGYRFIGFKRLIKLPFKEFKYSFITKKGYRDLLLGFFLSIFWAFYKTHIMIDIFHIQKKDRVRILNSK